MACRGVHFALTDEQLKGLLAARSDRAKIDFLQEKVEKAWDEENLVETDKAWEAIHRALARMDPKDQKMPEGSSEDPLAMVILGGKPVLKNEEKSAYIIRLIEPRHLPAIAAALATIDEAEFRTRFDTYCRPADDDFDDDHLEYAWDWFQAVSKFFKKVANQGRAVVFSVDQ
jgi:hypothetical protein